MKRRLIKKYSKEAKDKARKISPRRLRYLFKGWVKSFRQLSPTRQYAVAHAMEAAFGLIDFVRTLQRIRNNHLPKYPHGGILLEDIGEPILSAHESARLLKGEWKGNVLE